MRVEIAVTEEQIANCFPVMSELRPHLSAGGFVALIRRLNSIAGLELAYLRDGDDIKAVAGYRVSEWLAGGKYLEIEDLVSASSERSRGYGGELFDWLTDLAAQRGCRQVRLVSRTTREAAHRFYLRKGMSLEAYYFSMDVGVAARGDTNAQT